MSENLRLYHAGLYSMNAVVVRVDPTRWDEPSMCADWTCREVLGHVIWQARALAARASDGEPPAEQPEVEVAGDDPLANWIKARDRVLLALDQPGVVNREVAGPFGPMTVDFGLRLGASDTYTHSWDIGAAIDVDPHLDPGVAAAILPGLQAAGDGLRQPGLLGPEIDVPDDADIVTRFLAYCGRHPS